LDGRQGAVKGEGAPRNVVRERGWFAALQLDTHAVHATLFIAQRSSAGRTGNCFSDHSQLLCQMVQIRFKFIDLFCHCDRP
jgi:hypothetical protein